MKKLNPQDQLVARVAGVTLLFYIVAGISGMVLNSASPVRALIPLATSFSALLLGVTFYSITHKQQRDVALLALACRVVEAAPGEGTFFFAIASTLFSWLLFRGRIIPIPLSVLGMVASVLLVVYIPVQQMGYWGGPGSWSSPVTWVMWMPMLLFEVTLGLLLMIRGITQPLCSRLLIE